MTYVDDLFVSAEEKDRNGSGSRPSEDMEDVRT